MTDSENGSGRFTETLGSFAQMWSDFAMKMMSAGMAASPGSPPPQAAREVRAAVFRALNEQAENFMRSPAFLDMVRQSMNAAVDLRAQLNDFLTKAHHEMQGVARDDVDTIMLTIRHFESRVLDRLEAMERRIEELAKAPAAKPSRTESTAKPARPAGVKARPKRR